MRRLVRGCFLHGLALDGDGDVGPGGFKVFGGHFYEAAVRIADFHAGFVDFEDGYKMAAQDGHVHGGDCGRLDRF